MTTNSLILSLRATDVEKDRPLAALDTSPVKSELLIFTTLQHDKKVKCAIKHALKHSLQRQNMKSKHNDKEEYFEKDIKTETDDGVNDKEPEHIFIKQEYVEEEIKEEADELNN